MKASTKKFLPCTITVLVLAFGVYFNSLHNDFNFDDNAIVRDNELIRSLSNLPKIFVSNYWANTPYEKGVLLYRPLVVATFALDYALWGNNPFGFHLTNIVINTVNAALTVMLLGLLLGDKLSPLLLSVSALIFAFHPVHTEAINMVVGRTELLAAMFGLLTLILYFKGWKPAAFTTFFLALLCKEIAVTVPVVIFIYDRLFKRKVDPRNYVIFAGIGAVYIAIRLAVLRGLVSVHQTGILDRQDIFERALTVVKVLGYYLKLLVFPYPLTPDYSDVSLPTSILSLYVAVPAVLIPGLLYIAVRDGRVPKLISFAIFWFFVTILPVSNIISIGAFLGERFLYLPSVSVALMAAGIFCCARTKTAQTVLLGCWILVAALFAGVTFHRNYAWKNANTLWGKVLAQQPDNPRANFHMGVKCEEEKDYERALGFYEKAITHYPDHNWNPDTRTVQTVKERLSDIYYNLSLRRYKENKFAEASEYCTKALANNEKNAKAHVVIGNIYAQKDDFKKAAESYRAALRADTDQFEARENLKRIESLQVK